MDRCFVVGRLSKLSLWFSNPICPDIQEPDTYASLKKLGHKHLLYSTHILIFIMTYVLLFSSFQGNISLHGHASLSCRHELTRCPCLKS